MGRIDLMDFFINNVTKNDSGNLFLTKKGKITFTSLGNIL